MRKIRDMQKVYLGDGVYAECRDGMLALTTSDGMRDTNTIYLELEVLAALEVALDTKTEAEGDSDA